MRTPPTAFMGDLQERLANRVQLTTDGHRPYLTAVRETFGKAVDYARLVKRYGPAPVTLPPIFIQGPLESGDR